MKSRFRAVGLVLSFLVFFAAPVFSQQDSSAGLNEGEGIAVGPFIFSPSLELSWEYRDNIFYEENTPVGDDIYTAKGRFMFELPYYNAYLRFVYSPKYRVYDKFDEFIPEHWSHVVDVVGAVELGFGLNLRTVYRYVSGNLETPEVDPGLEHVWGYRQFAKHDLHLTAEYWLTHTDAVFVEGGYIDLQHKRAKGPYADDGFDLFDWTQDSTFYDYSRWFMGAGWLHQLSETAKLDVRYRREEFQAHQTLSWRDSVSDELTVGLNGQLTEVLTSDLRVGWRRTEFETAETGPQIDEYSGLSASGTVSWLMAHGSTLSLNLIRWDYPSAYGRNAFYTSVGGGLQYSLTKGRLFGNASYRIRSNDYDLPDPITGEDRSDDITQIGFGLGFWLTDWLSLRGNVYREERQSLQQFEYDSTGYLLGLSVGY